MRKITIGFDGSRAFDQHRTGTENYSYQLLKALAKIDKQNNYIVYIRDLNNVATIVQQMFFPKNFKIVKIPWPRLWTQGGLGIQTFKDKLDVLFVPAHTLPIIRRPGLKTVVTVHDLGSEYLPQMHQIKQRAYLSLMQKYQLKGASQIIAVSKATKRDLINKFESSAFKRSFQASLIKKIGIESSKIAVIYEGYDEKKFKVDVLINGLRQYDIETGKYFLFVGTVQPRKNLERVILAFSRFISSEKPVEGSLKLVIVGQKGWLSDEIYNLPKKLGIEKRVKFLGYVPEKELPALYKGAQALVFPSFFEGFGLPILEAQACGCPVLTSNTSSMPEVGGKGAVYVNPYSEEDIIRGMREIRGNREKLIKAGFENVKKFSWEKCARETLAVLEKV